MGRYLPLDQTAHTPNQPDFECFQRWVIHHLSEEPVTILIVKKPTKLISYI